MALEHTPVVETALPTARQEPDVEYRSNRDAARSVSDFPDQIEMGIDAILSANFLNAEQKADILCNNAARFLRLDANICKSL